MLVSYQYRALKNGTTGWFQCDKADFLQMFRNKKWQHDCMWCRVKCDGTTYMWTKETNWFVPRDEQVNLSLAFGGK